MKHLQHREGRDCFNFGATLDFSAFSVGLRSVSCPGISSSMVLAGVL